MTVRWPNVIFVWTLVLAMAVLGGCTHSGDPPKPDPIAVGVYTYASDLAAHRIEALMEQSRIPGAAAALIDDQEVVWQDSGLARSIQNTSN